MNDFCFKCEQIEFYYMNGIITAEEAQRLYDEHRDKEMLEVIEGGFMTTNIEP